MIWKQLETSKFFVPFNMSTHPLDQLAVDPLEFPGLEWKPLTMTTTTESGTAINGSISANPNLVSSSINGGSSAMPPMDGGSDAVAPDALPTAKEKKAKRLPIDRRPTTEFFRSVSCYYYCVFIYMSTYLYTGNRTCLD